MTRTIKLMTLSTCLALILATAFSHGQPGKASTGQKLDTVLLGQLKWRNIGPNRGGRSIACAGSVARPLEYYFGATGGGLWKTTDGGQTWNAVTDGQIKSSSVGAVAVAESNPDIVYIGMGEVQLRGNIMQGDGVYKSTNGGKTWNHLGLKDTQAIGRIRIHPTNPDIVYVAALGHPFGPNDERGIFRSRDGGKTWQRILFRSDHAGAVDLCFDPQNPQILFASIWEVQRTPWSLSSGGPKCGLFKTSDGGDNWTEITRADGLPRGLVGRIGVSVSGGDSRRVYAIIEAVDGGVFRSDDAGVSWKRVNDERNLRQRAFYYTRIFADPQVPDTVYVVNTGFYRSTDGGKTYTAIRVPHGDNHDVWIAANDPKRMINSNDGGSNVSFNGGETWSSQAYPTAQLYHVATTADFPYHVCGAQQDNSTICVPSDGSRGRVAPLAYAVGGGESGYIAPHPKNPNIFYAGSYGGLLTRFDRSTGHLRDVQIYPTLTMGMSSGVQRERFQWTFPIVFSPHDATVLYAASQHLWKSTNEGQSWERISSDLTRGDPKTLGDSGGPITKDQTGVETYATIFTVAPSRLEHDTIWTGSDDGLVHITRNGGKSWDNITPDLPPFSRISMIESSPHKPGTAYLAAKRYQMEDRTPYIMKTDDFGKSWKRIVTGIPSHDFVQAVREDPKRPGLLYAGTEHGIYFSLDDGVNWQSLSLNLPDTQVSDLVVEEHDLVIATHGRSFYILDDIDSLRQMTPTVVAASVHLFQPRPAFRSVKEAVIDYYLQKPADKVTIEVLDGKGQLIRSFTGSPADQKKKASADTDQPAKATARPPATTAGVHRFTWDLRYPGALVFDGIILWAARAEQGPLAPPGKYQVRVTVNGQIQSQPLVIKKDPRLTDVTDADLAEQFGLALKVRDKTSEANDMVIRIRALKAQVKERIDNAKAVAITKAGEALSDMFSAVEGELYQVQNKSSQDPLNYPVKLNNQLAALQRIIETGDGRPTAQSHAVFGELGKRLDTLAQRFGELLANELPRFNQQLADAKLDPIPVDAGKGK